MSDESALRRYVLGLAEEPERTRIEEQLFASDEVFEQVRAIEAEVIDEYVGGELRDTEARSFDRLLARSERLMSEVRLARSFRHTAAPGEPMVAVRSARTKWLSVAAGLLAAVTGGLLLTRGVSDQTSGSVSPSPPMAARGPEVTSPPADTAPRVLATFTLSGRLVRSGSRVPELAIPRGDGVIHLRLLLEPGDDYPAYTAQLSSSAGDVVWEAVALPSERTQDGPTVLATLPAARLIPGRYEVLLKGRSADGTLEDLAVYRFRARR